MDAATELLSGFAERVRFDDLAPEVVHCVRRITLDSIGCAVGGSDSVPAALARRLAAQVSGSVPVPVLGQSEGSTPEMATFANTVMLRHLDCNDVFFSSRGNGAHPSDMLPAILAAASAGDRSGRRFVEAVVLAYEALCWCSEGAPFSNLGGWDYGLFLSIGAALGVGKVLGLDRRALGHAVSLAVVPNVPLGVTRTGSLSMWKGCASAYAAMAGMFAARLAAEGMTGPDEPFSGKAGVWEQVASGRSPVEAGALGDTPMGIERSSFKRYPAQSHTQGPIGLALQIRREVDPDDITAIRITTFAAAVEYSARGPARWRPTTKETADHSIPYTAATALVEGDITPSSFDATALRRPATRRLIETMAVDEEPAFTAAFPGEERCRMEVTTVAGRVHVAETAHPVGHRGNPLTDAQLEEKFHRLSEPWLSSQRREEVVRRCWGLDDLADVTSLLAAVGPLATSTG